MKRVLLATAVLVPLVACSNSRHDSSPSSSNAPPSSVTESEGVPMDPAANPTATRPPTKLQASPVPGESGVSNSSSALSGGGGGP